MSIDRSNEPVPSPVHYVLANADLWIGDGRSFDGHVVVAGDTIEAVGEGGYGGSLPVMDLGGLALSPGMIDLMVLGGFDRSILRDDPVEIAAEYLRLGVTSCQFCIGTLPWTAVRTIADKIAAATAAPTATAARVLGLYLEGPFQQPDLTGASLREHALPPTDDHVRRIIDDLGRAVTMVNVAPGLPGDAAAVRRLREAGKVVSMAHSDAAADAVLRCLNAGTAVLGHAWDNNPGRIGDSGVQQPTLEHVAMIDERITSIHLICDGVHVDPVLIRMMLRCRGIEPLCLVTDGNQRAGCPDGPFASDDGRRFHKERGVCRTDTGWLAGSATLLPDMFRLFVRFTGLSAAEAVRTVTLNPAACLGVQDRIGLLAPGRAADLVAWDDRLCVRRVWRAGREVANVSAWAEVAFDA